MTIKSKVEDAINQTGPVADAESMEAAYYASVDGFDQAACDANMAAGEIALAELPNSWDMFGEEAK